MLLPSEQKDQSKMNTVFYEFPQNRFWLWQTSCWHAAVIKITVPDGVGVVVVDAPVVVTLVVGTAVVVVDSAAIVTHAHTQTIVLRPLYKQDVLARQPRWRENFEKRCCLQHLCLYHLLSLTTVSCRVTEDDTSAAIILYNYMQRYVVIKTMWLKIVILN